jgi:hypothetical protein
MAVCNAASSLTVAAHDAAVVVAPPPRRRFFPPFAAHARSWGSVLGQKPPPAHAYAFSPRGLAGAVRELVARNARWLISAAYFTAPDSALQQEGCTESHMARAPS